VLHAQARQRPPARSRLILTHGWPWTFWHWSKVSTPSRPGRVRRLNDPPTRSTTSSFRPCPASVFPCPLIRLFLSTSGRVSDLCHTLITETLYTRSTGPPVSATRRDRPPASSPQVPDELSYCIHIGSVLPLALLQPCPVPWYFALNRPLTDDQPADFLRRPHQSSWPPPLGVHLAVHLLDGATAGPWAE